VAPLTAAPEEGLGEPRLRRKLAWELYFSGNLEAALPVADALLAGKEQGPEADSVRLLKGLVLSAEGRNTEALELLDKIRQGQPDNTALAMTVTRLFQREGRHGEAAVVLRGLLDELARGGKTDSEPEVRLELAEVYFDAKEWDKLAEALAPLLQSTDEGVRTQAVVLQAEALAEAKKYDEALAALDRGGSGPSGQPNPVLESRRAEVLIHSGREREGRERLEALAKSGNSAAVLSAAQSLHRLERYQESIPVLQDLIAAHPDQVIAHFLLGAAYERTGQREQAVAALRRVLSIQPDFHAALNYLGYTFAEAGENLDEALKLIQRAVALDPDNGSYVDSLGWAYYQLGRHDEARGYLERAVRLEPADATLQEHLGDVYVALGQNDRAREAYHRALELGDDNAEQVRRKLDRLESATPRPRP
jgi:tetratricopeptide (TPR) repeat protein